MKTTLIKESTLAQLKEHYKKTPATRLEFDKNRPNFYENKGGPQNDPMMNQYRDYLLKKGFIYMVVG